MVKTDTRKTISLGLQGGGTYGAFTWGVLDRLLEEDIAIDAIGGSSSGAVNAVVLADGYAQGGGRQGAQAALRRFWTGLGTLALFTPLRPTPIDFMSGGWSVESNPLYHMMEAAGAIMGPVLQTPVTHNPLRNIFSSLINFERVRACEEIELYVAATNVRTGTGKLFMRAEMDAQRLLASACLPTVFAAVEVDGESYWDGSFVANPPLAPLQGREARDVIVVQNNPIARSTMPRSMADISNRANEVAFNISFVREISSLTHVGGVPDEQRGASMALEAMRLHLISGTDVLGNYAISSKFIGDLPFLQQLHAQGVAAAETWLRENWHAVGTHSTLDPSPVFFADQGLRA
ncbi:patatin-like phospholipase family protein [Pseudoduganella plicata]|uniref:Patatin-like phospholipase family protein n=1 Tax=Pseudoduganella plicata TaxID=321984 RepID=A0ABX5SK73_9BURK|nr:patatin-like phospholipase family protein [Pseudoduganella plicata]